ncbi:MAG: CHASE2 domain-containing protein, partial [Candidatus Omnitrophica bacterium]|nr:CHASE2 domain-containing protein [Candidatus Omnitrophota bacterium]
MSRGVLSSLSKAGLIGILVSLLYLTILEPFSILEIPKLKTQDLFFSARYFLTRPQPILSDIVLITIDDESIEKIQERWPFRRKVYAQLLEKITASQPRLVGFDFIFSGKGEPSDDFLLSQALAKSGQTILASVVDLDGNYILPLDELVASAQSVGTVNKLLDRDLNVRRSNLMYLDKDGNVVSWSWETEIMISLLNLDRTRYQITPKSIQFESGRFFVPFYDSNKRWTMINYRANLKEIDHIPLWQALKSKDLASRLADKIVLVGATSQVLHDYYHTPLGLMPGVVVNLNLLGNLLARDFIKKIPMGFNMLFVFLLVFLASYLSIRENVLRSFVILALATASFLVGFFILFENNYLGDYLTPFLGGWVIFT